MFTSDGGEQHGDCGGVDLKAAHRVDVLREEGVGGTRLIKPQYLKKNACPVHQSFAQCCRAEFFLFSAFFNCILRKEIY